MKLLKESFNLLKKYNYFESNYLLTFNLPNKKHRRKVESFICCADNYKMYLKAYLNLLDLVIKNEDNFRWDLYNMYRELTTVRDRARELIDTRCINMMRVLLLSLLSNGRVLDIGLKRIDCTLGDVISILNDQSCNEVQTMKKISKILKTSTSSMEFRLTLDCVINLLEPVLVQACFPELLLEKDILSEYAERISHLVDVFNEDLKTNSHMFKLATFYCRHDEFKYDLINEREPLNRRGFLKEEKRNIKVGTQFLKVFRNGINPDAMIDRRAHLDLTLTELIMKDGLVTTYQAVNDDFIVYIIEDNINERIYGNLVFIDGILKTNTEESVSGMLAMYYTVMRYSYGELLSNVDNLTNKIKTKYIRKEKSLDKNSENNYHYETIQIQPYIRKLPVGSVASEHSVKEAKRFNLVLKSDETFVSGFPREQRYKNTYEDGKTNLFQ